MVISNIYKNRVWIIKKIMSFLYLHYSASSIKQNICNTKYLLVVQHKITHAVKTLVSPSVVFNH